MGSFDSPESCHQRDDIVQLEAVSIVGLIITPNIPKLLTIWKACAINARDPTTNPTPSSRTKNAASIASIIVIRVDFDHAILTSQQNIRLPDRKFQSSCGFVSMEEALEPGGQVLDDVVTNPKASEATPWKSSKILSLMFGNGFGLYYVAPAPTLMVRKAAVKEWQRSTRR